MKVLLKILLFICAVFLCIPELSAQSIADLNRQGKEYFEKGMYREAEVILTQALKTLENSKNTAGLEYAEILNGLANIYTKKGQYSKADSLYVQALDIRQEKLGDSSLEYAETLNDHSEMFGYMQQFSELEEPLQKACNIRAKKLGKKSPEYAESLSNLGYFYYTFSENPKKAGKMLKEASNIYLKTLGENSPQYARSLLFQSFYFYINGDFDSAEEYCEKAIEINRKVLREGHHDHTIGLLFLSTVYAEKGYYQEAVLLILEALPIVEDNFGKMHPDYAGGLSNLGGIYYKMGEKEKAESTLWESLEITKKILGEKHSYYFNALNTLATVYLDAGFYEKAAPLYVQSLDLRKELYGDSHISVSNAMNSLGNLYMLMGNYPEAERWLNEALQTERSRSKDPSLRLAVILTNLASIYSQSQRILLALPLLEEASSIQKKNIGENHPDYLTVLSQIIHYKFLSGEDNAVIEAMFLDIVQKYKSNFSETHPGYMNSLIHLANFYMLTDNYEKADGIYNQWFQNVDLMEENDPNYVVSLMNMGSVKSFLKKCADAQNYYSRAYEALRNQVLQNFTSLSEEEQYMFWASRNVSIGQIQLFAKTCGTENLSGSALAYDCELLTKSLLLNSSRQIRLSILNSEDELLIEWWESLVRLRKIILNQEDKYIKLEKELLANLSLNSFDELEVVASMSRDKEFIHEINEIKQIKGQFNKLKNELYQEERDIAKEAPAYGKQLRDFSVRWSDIQQSLDVDEAAIEFIRFEESEINKPILVHYCALILRPGYSHPEMITLCDEDELKTAIQQSPYDGKAVYPLVWEPLEKHLKNVKNIYIAPSGLLHSVSFEGMRKENHYLGDDYVIHNLLSTKDIITIKEKSEKSENINNVVLFGGADFSLSQKELAQLDNNLEKSSFDNLTRSMLDDMDPTRGQGFDYLPGSKKEVQIIAKELTDLGWEASLFVDKEATETRFKSLSSSRSPRILHISTHGFYFPLLKTSSDGMNMFLTSETTNTYRISNNPLMRSGLAFTGANHVWSGKELSEDTDDGILTAYEVANMNLSNTELVVLSACETGLGDVVESEGVYGLQRAFRLAGVQSMIISLWKIPDAETVELMEEFYGGWAKGASKKEALTTAQKKLRQSYPDNPEKWAGFVLIE